MGWQSVKRLLRGMAGYAVRRSASLEIFPQLDITTVQAVVLYIHQKTISPAALEALDRFVNSGGGVVGIHSATASFRKSPHYFEILGGQFTKHGAVEPFEVVPASGENGPFDGIGSFIIRDEIYIHDLQAGIHTHFHTIVDDKSIPVASYPLAGKAPSARTGKRSFCTLTSVTRIHTCEQSLIRRSSQSKPGGSAWLYVMDHQADLSQSVSSWALGGDLFRKLLNKHYRLFNWAMGTILIYTAVSSVL
ncbi:MAG: hypothetical protein EHM70_00840 [Chloroflexota bacterium]|nr:MAG: hypothetical protein EHM70_00840 [Chloroflexota bacterium]